MTAETQQEVIASACENGVFSSLRLVYWKLNVVRRGKETPMLHSLTRLKNTEKGWDI